MNNLYSKWLKIENKQIVEKLQGFSKEQIVSNFNGTLSFGTAGLRGIMDFGSNRLNVVNVCKLANGVLKYYQKKKYKSIVIGYDTRHNSKLFAQTFANVMANGGIKVNIHSCYVPTPLLIFSIAETKSDMGVMITASHNNKEYNGIKI